MKKILVAIAAAAMTLAGLTAPAHATVISQPTIPATAMVGTTVTATRGSYTGEVDAGSFWMFCSTPQSVATMENSTARNNAMFAGTCDYVTLARFGSIQSSTSLTIPTVVYGNYNNDAKLSAGKTFYFIDSTGTGSPWTYHSSAGMTITAPAATYPTLTGGTSGYIANGTALNHTAGSTYQVIGTLQYAYLIACNYDVSPVQGTTAAALNTGNANDCFSVATPQGNALSYPWTVGPAQNAFTSTAVPDLTGYYLYWIEYFSDVYSHTNTFWSSPLRVGVAAQTVTYNANSGTGAITASVANGARNVSDGSGFALSGFNFAGWNTAANGSGTAVAAGASYTPSGNVTLYAQWTRIPTPPAPVFTSPIAAAPVGGILNLSGSNMANVTSITVGNVAATVATSSTGQVTVKLPDLAPGKYDITIKNADGGIRFIDGLVVPDPNAKAAPKPTNTYVASSAVKVTGAAPSAKQAAVLTEFVAQYKNAKQATVYIRTSKAGLAAAKKAAAAMLATAVKTLKNVKTGIVVDSTTETTTSLDLVVND